MHLRSTISWNSSLSGTGLSKSSWRALKFLGGKRCGTLRPFPSRPSPQSPSSTQIPHFLQPHRVSTGTLCSSVPPRASICVACPGCLSLADALEEQKDAACCSLMPRLLATHCARPLTETGAMDRTFVAIRTKLCIGNGMSRASS